MTYLKGYMKNIKSKLQESNPDRVPAFEKGAAAFAKKVLGNINDWQFFTGESMDPDGMVGESLLSLISQATSSCRLTRLASPVLMNYREDGVTPYMVFWKDGVKEVKLVRNPSVAHQIAQQSHSRLSTLSVSQ